MTSTANPTSATRNHGHDDPNPDWPPSISPYVTPPNVTAIPTAPGSWSGLGFAVRSSSDRPANAMTSASAANGRFRKKIQRHDATWMSRPPSGGPIIVPIPLHAVHWPTALPASSP